VTQLLRTLASPADAPLDPSPGEARSWLQRELLDPEYHQQNVVERLITWLERQIGGGLATAGLLSTAAAILIFLLLLGALAWLLSRVQRTRGARAATGPVLGHEVVTAAELRARAEAALADGRPEEALVDGFRALAVRQVERGRLDDSPGATAHEVALLLATEYPQHRARVGDNALLFDLVLYGDRPATPEQATGVLVLDDELAGAAR
jgi:cbb3-type cytochrome oxidase subunit 3